MAAASAIGSGSSTTFHGQTGDDQFHLLHEIFGSGTGQQGSLAASLGGPVQKVAQLASALARWIPTGVVHTNRSATIAGLEFKIESGHAVGITMMAR